MYAGTTLFAQVMDFLPWKTFHRLVARYEGNRGMRTLSCAEQYRVLAFAQLTGRESLRDIEASLSAQSAKLYHMGIRSPVRRSTLADANERRDWRIHAEFAQRLIAQARALYAGEDLGLELDNTVYALDSSTIDLCLSVFPWALFRTTKSGVKLHTLLDLRGSIPAFIHVSHAKMGDVKVLDLLIPEPGAFYIMDRAYLDFTRLNTVHTMGAFFVTRAKSNTKFRRRYSRPVDKSAGLLCDQTVVLTGVKSKDNYPQPLRRVKYRDPQTGRTFNFLTNNFAVPALTVADLYRCRWQVELFFKWIKQHLRIKSFLGTSENAVKTQIWVAVSVYVLVAIVKKRLGLEVSLYTFLQVLSVTLFEKTQLNQGLFDSPLTTEPHGHPNQLNLFDF